MKEILQLASNIRKDVLSMTYHAGVNGGHIGGSLSCAEILAVLYGKIMDINEIKKVSEDRDRFILSKGHIAIAHYAVLAECGIISKDELLTFEMPNSFFQTHEYMDVTKGIEITGGSLGYGISYGVGISLAAKINGQKFNTYVVVGDGECNEGSIWESIMSAVKFKLENLTIIVDNNKQQLDGFTNKVMPILNLKKSFESFGCNVVAVNGHDVSELYQAFNVESNGCPKVIIADTKKAAGIKSIENTVGWHHANINEEQYRQFLGELE